MKGFMLCAVDGISPIVLDIAAQAINLSIPSWKNTTCNTNYTALHNDMNIEEKKNQIEKTQLHFRYIKYIFNISL